MHSFDPKWVKIFVKPVFGKHAFLVRSTVKKNVQKMSYKLSFSREKPGSKRVYAL